MPILTLWFECQHNNGGSFAHLQFDLTEHSSGEYSILLWTCVIYILSIWGEVSAVYIIFKSWLKIDNCLKRYSLQLRHLHSSQSSVFVSWQEPYSGRINCFFVFLFLHSLMCPGVGVVICCVCLHVGGMLCLSVHLFLSLLCFEAVQGIGWQVLLHLAICWMLRACLCLWMYLGMITVTSMRPHPQE